MQQDAEMQYYVLIRVSASTASAKYCSSYGPSNLGEQ
jgi:hypothetical protein